MANRGENRPEGEALTYAFAAFDFPINSAPALANEQPVLLLLKTRSVSSHSIKSAIRHLKARGIVFEEGLSEIEVVKVEETCKCRLPPDYRQFLKLALPVSGGFPNWRSESKVVLRRLLDRPWNGIKFDIEHNGFWAGDWGPHPQNTIDAIEEAQQCFESAPILVPVRSNHYIPAFPAAEGNPILSVRQSDISVASGNLTSYLSDFPQAYTLLSSRHIPFWSAVAQGRQIKVPDLSAEHVGHPDEYEEFRTAVESAGYWAKMTPPHKGSGVTLYRQMPSHDRERSLFWVSKRAFGWLLCIRGPRFYYAPQADRIPELCLTLLAQLPEDPGANERLPSWAFHLDDAIRSDFGLVAIKHSEWEDEWEARLRSFESIGWREMSSGQADDAWDNYKERLGYPNGDAFHTPEPASTWDISFVYLRDATYLTDLESDLAQKALAALQDCVGPGEELLALDWNHRCYFFNPHHRLANASLSSWAVPILPNGDHYIFVTKDFRLGIVGNCVDQTICVFGKPLLDAFASRKPLIFKRLTWTAEERLEYQRKWAEAGWNRLSHEDKEERWGSFGEQFQFFDRQHNQQGPRIVEPSPSITWDISMASVADETAREKMEVDLTRKVLNAMCKVVQPDERFYSFDAIRWYEHYSFLPHQLTSVRRDEWALPVFPDDAYTVFVTSEMEFGLFGDPLDKTICVFGHEFVEAICADPPDLFRKPVRKNGHPLL